MMGILTGKFNADSKFDEEDVRHSLRFDFSQGRLSELLVKVESIREILTADGRTMAQGALGWIAPSAMTLTLAPGTRRTATWVRFQQTGGGWDTPRDSTPAPTNNYGS